MAIISFIGASTVVNESPYPRPLAWPPPSPPELRVPLIEALVVLVVVTAAVAVVVVVGRHCLVH